MGGKFVSQSGFGRLVLWRARDLVARLNDQVEAVQNSMWFYHEGGLPVRFRCFLTGEHGRGHEAQKPGNGKEVWPCP